MSSAPVVVKVGGSLFDLPDLGPRLVLWLTRESPSPPLRGRGVGVRGPGTGENPTPSPPAPLPRVRGRGEEEDRTHATPVLLIPGGGPTADVVRMLDRDHGLGEETAHWLALRALALNAHFLAALLPGAVVVETLDACPPLWRAGRLALLDAHAFARDDDRRPDHLPHAWAVTSDSVAARVADVAGARRLILLKSTALPSGIDWSEASRRGLVDAYFPEALARRRTPFAVSAVNLRDWRI